MTFYIVKNVLLNSATWLSTVVVVQWTLLPTKQYANIVINDIAPPHGGNCGGFTVNDQFEKLLIDILRISPEKFNQLKIICLVQWNTLMNKKFEYMKYT